MPREPIDHLEILDASTNRVERTLAMQVEAGLMREAILQRRLQEETAYGRSRYEQAIAADEARRRMHGELIYLTTLLKRIASLEGEGTGLQAIALALAALKGLVVPATRWTPERPTGGLWLLNTDNRILIGRVGTYHHDPTGALWFLSVNDDTDQGTRPLDDLDAGARWFRLPDDLFT